MASAYNMVEYFNYPELSNNYDAMYDTLMSGGTVWLHLNYNNTTQAVENMGADNYLRFMVTEWAMTYDGLMVVCPDESRLYFTNGSHTPDGGK